MADLQYTLGLDPSAFGSGIRGAIGTAGDLSNALRGLSDLWDNVLDAFADTAAFESTTAAINTMTGSMAQTRAIMAELADFASATPFELPEIAQAARQMLGAGTSATDLRDQLRIMGDVAAGAGTDLGGLVTVMNQVEGKGKLLNEEFLQLTERGVAGLRQELSKVTGVPVEQLSEAMSNGVVSADHLREAFRNMTSEGGLYFESMAAQSQTFNGMLSTMRDDVAAFMREFEGPALELLKPAMAEVSAIAKEMTAEARTFVGVLQQAGQDGRLAETLNLYVQYGLKSAWVSFLEFAIASIPSLGEILYDVMYASIKASMTGNIWAYPVLFIDNLGGAMKNMFADTFSSLEETKAKIDALQSPVKANEKASDELDEMQAKVNTINAEQQKAAEEQLKTQQKTLAAWAEPLPPLKDKAQSERQKSAPSSTPVSDLPTRTPRPPALTAGRDRAGSAMAQAMTGETGEAAAPGRTPGRIQGYSYARQGGAARVAQMGSLSNFYGRPGTSFGNLGGAATNPTAGGQAGAQQKAADQQAGTLEMILRELQRIRTE